MGRPKGLLHCHKNVLFYAASTSGMFAINTPFFFLIGSRCTSRDTVVPTEKQTH